MFTTTSGTPINTATLIPAAGNVVRNSDWSYTVTFVAYGAWDATTDAIMQIYAPHSLTGGDCQGKDLIHTATFKAASLAASLSASLDTGSGTNTKEHRLRSGGPHVITLDLSWGEFASGSISTAAVAATFSSSVHGTGAIGGQASLSAWGVVTQTSTTQLQISLADNPTYDLDYDANAWDTLSFTVPGAQLLRGANDMTVTVAVAASTATFTVNRGGTILAATRINELSVKPSIPADIFGDVPASNWAALEVTVTEPWNPAEMFNASVHGCCFKDSAVVTQPEYYNTLGAATIGTGTTPAQLQALYQDGTNSLSATGVYANRDAVFACEGMEITEAGTDSFSFRFMLGREARDLDIVVPEHVTFTVPAMFTTSPTAIKLQGRLEITAAYNNDWNSPDTSGGERKLPYLSLPNVQWEFSEAVLQNDRVTAGFASEYTGAGISDGFQVVWNGADAAPPTSLYRVWGDSTESTAWNARKSAAGGEYVTVVAGTTTQRLKLGAPGVDSKGTYDITADEKLYLAIHFSAWGSYTWPANAPTVNVPLDVAADTNFQMAEANPGYLTVKATKLTITPTTLTELDVRRGNFQFVVEIEEVGGSQDRFENQLDPASAAVFLAGLSASPSNSFWGASSGGLLQTAKLQQSPISGASSQYMELLMCPTSGYDLASGANGCGTPAQYNLADDSSETITFTMPAAVFEASPSDITVSNTVSVTPSTYEISGTFMDGTQNKLSHFRVGGSTIVVRMTSDDLFWPAATVASYWRGVIDSDGAEWPAIEANVICDTCVTLSGDNTTITITFAADRTATLSGTEVITVRVPSQAFGIIPGVGATDPAYGYLVPDGTGQSAATTNIHGFSELTYSFGTPAAEPTQTITKALITETWAPVATGSTCGAAIVGNAIQYSLAAAQAQCLAMAECAAVICPTGTTEGCTLRDAATQAVDALVDCYYQMDGQVVNTLSIVLPADGVTTAEWDTGMSDGVKTAIVQGLHNWGKGAHASGGWNARRLNILPISSFAFADSNKKLTINVVTDSGFSPVWPERITVSIPCSAITNPGGCAEVDCPMALESPFTIPDVDPLKFACEFAYVDTSSEPDRDVFECNWKNDITGQELNWLRSQPRM